MSKEMAQVEALKYLCSKSVQSAGVMKAEGKDNSDVKKIAVKAWEKLQEIGGIDETNPTD